MKNSTTESIFLYTRGSPEGSIIGYGPKQPSDWDCGMVDRNMRLAGGCRNRYDGNPHHARLFSYRNSTQMVAEVAFNLWLSSAFRTDPEKALLTSVEMLRGKTSAELFLVPRRNSIRREIHAPRTDEAPFSRGVRLQVIANALSELIGATQPEKADTA